MWTPTPWNPKREKATAAALVAQLTDEQVALLARQDHMGLVREIAAARKEIVARGQTRIAQTPAMAPRPRLGILALRRDA